MADLRYRLLNRSRTLHRGARGVAAALTRWRSGNSRHPIAIISIPKAGTHLLITLLHETGAAKNSWRHVMGIGSSSLGDAPVSPDVSRHIRNLRRGQFMTLHHPHFEALVQAFRDRGIRTLFIHRDPRAVALSFTHYVRGLPRHWLHERWVAMDFDDAMLASMQGVAPDESGRGVPSLADRYDAYAGWLDDADLILRFEDLAEGGACRDARLEQLAELLELEPRHRAALLTGADQWIGHRGSPTMRTGTPGGWRREVSVELADRLTEAFGTARLTTWTGDTDRSPSESQ